MTDPIEIDRRLAAARAIAQDAARLAMRMRPAPGGPTGTRKGMQDYLTEADGAVETLIAERLAALFPEDGFLGEEGGGLRHGALTWVVDPIDGTSNYARGRDRWCVSIGLLDGEEPVAGVIEAPALGETYIGRRGQGATLNGAPLKASSVDDTRTAMIEMGWSARVPARTFVTRIDAIMALGAMPRSGGSGALAIADVASGRLDGYCEIVINLWDVAAALVLIGESGAVASPFLRQGGLTGPGTLLVACPGIADALARAVDVPLS